MNHDEKLVARIATLSHCADCGIAGHCLHGGEFCFLDPFQIDIARAIIPLIQKDLIERMMNFEHPSMYRTFDDDLLLNFATEIGIEIE